MKCETQKGILKVTPGAAIDNSTLQAMATELLAAIANLEKGMPVEISLLETTEADSGTIKFLLAASVDCRQRGLKLAVRAAGKTGDLLQTASMARHIDLILEEPSK